MENIQACLASNMRRYRKQLHLSQEKLAEKAHASTNYIAMIENGRCFPSLPMLQQIAGALGIDALDLFDKGAVDCCNRDSLKERLLAAMTQTVNEIFG